jgi:hypothetical protein
MGVLMSHVRPTRTRRATRLLAAVALLAATLSVLDLTATEPPPAAAQTSATIVNTANAAWLSMRDFTMEGTSWQERTSQFNFLVRHAPNETVTGVQIDLDGSGGYGGVDIGSGNSCETSNCGNEDRTVAGGGVNVIRLAAGVPEPGSTTGSYYSLVQVRGTLWRQDNVGSNRQQPRTIRARVNLNTGNTPEVSAQAWGSADSQVTFSQDYPVPTNIPDSIDTAVYPPNGSVFVQVGCDDRDSGAFDPGDDECEDSDYRWRRVTDGVTTNANGTSNTTASTYMNVCCDNRTGVAREYVLPAMSGRWILEQRFREGAFNASEDCEDHGDLYPLNLHGCWFYIGVYTVDDAADPPAPTLSADTTRPNTGANVTLTAGALVDGPGTGAPVTLGNWNADCYDNRDFTNYRGSFTQSGPTFSTNWGSGGPSCGLTSNDTFAVRYTQTVTVSQFGTVVVSMDTDDGHAFFIDGVLCGQSKLNSGTQVTTDLRCPVNPGTRTFRLDYDEGSGSARVALTITPSTNADDRQGIQVVDVDTRTTPGGTPDGTYDARYISTAAAPPYAGFTSNQQVHVQSTSGLTPGVYAARVRSCDTGITICGDFSGTAESNTVQFRVNAPPTVTPTTLFAKRGQTTSFSVLINDTDETATPLGGQASYTSNLTGTNVTLPGGGGTYTCGAPVNSSPTDGVAQINCTVSVNAGATVGDRDITMTATDNNLGTSPGALLRIRVIYEDGFTQTTPLCTPNPVAAGARSVCTFTVTDLSRGQGGAALTGPLQSPPSGGVGVASNSPRTDFYPATPTCTLANPSANQATCQIAFVNRSPETVTLTGTYTPTGSSIGVHNISTGAGPVNVSGCTSGPVVYNTQTLVPAGTPGVGSGAQPGVQVSGVGYNYRPTGGCAAPGGLWGQFATLGLVGGGTQTFKTFEAPVDADGRWTQNATIDTNFFQTFLADATFRVYGSTVPINSPAEYGNAYFVSPEYSYSITQPLRAVRTQADPDGDGTVQASIVADPDSEPAVDQLAVDGETMSVLKARVDDAAADVATVSRVFHAALGRAARHGELTDALADLRDGGTTAQLAARLADRSEFAARYGHLDDAGFVDAVFTDVLDRAPDAGERSRWLAELGGGADRSELVAELADSAENQWRTVTRDYVAAAYATLSDRTPGPNDLARYRQLLDDGVVKVQVLEDIALSLAPAGFWADAVAGGDPPVVTAEPAAQSIDLGDVPESAAVGDRVTLAPTTTSGLWARLRADGACRVVRGRTVEFTAAGTCTVTATQSGDGEYLPAEPVEATIRSRATQTVTFPALPTTPGYGDIATLSATASSGLPVSYAATGSCVIHESAVVFTSPGTCTVTAGQDGDRDVAPATPVSRTVTVGKGAQTVTLTALPAGEIGTTVAVAASAGSGLPVTLAASGACTLSGSTVTYTAAGTCTVTATQAGDHNWAPGSATRTATVARKAQTVTLTGVPDTLKRKASVTVTASAGSGLPVTLTASGQCTVAGNVVTAANKTGTCTLSAIQPGDAVWAPAPTVTRTIRIT